MNPAMQPAEKTTLEILEHAARQVATAVKHETPVTAEARVTIHPGGLTTVAYVVALGDVLGRAKWPWIRESAVTPEAAVTAVLDTVSRVKYDRNCQIEKLRESAASIGFAVVPLAEAVATASESARQSEADMFSGAPVGAEKGAL
jgi:Fe-S cluster assembly iron-binding protein IscA